MEKHICEVLMEYVISLGVKNISALEGIYTNKIDDNWTIKCNGKSEEIDGIPPLTWTIEFNGWPAGIVSIFGEGEIAAGEMGNEENLRKAITRKMGL